MSICIVVHAIFFKIKQDIEDLETLLLNTNPNSAKSEFAEPHAELRPVHYKLQIHPHSEKAFTGIVDIVLFCFTETKTITLNLDDLHINASSSVITQISRGKRSPQTIENQNYEGSFIYKITLNSYMKTNTSYSIHIEFSGNISKDFEGLYRTKHKNKQ